MTAHEMKHDANIVVTRGNVWVALRQGLLPDFQGLLMMRQCLVMTALSKPQESHEGTEPSTFHAQRNTILCLVVCVTRFHYGLDSYQRPYHDIVAYNS